MRVTKDRTGAMVTLVYGIFGYQIVKTEPIVSDTCLLPKTNLESSGEAAGPMPS